MTNYRTHSTEKSKPIEIGFSEHDKDRLGWEVGNYSTFGLKYPDSEAEENATWESTTEQISVEELEKQLLDVLDKLAQQSSD